MLTKPCRSLPSARGPKIILQPRSTPTYSLRRMSSSAPLINVLSKSKSPYLLQHKDNPVAVSLPHSGFLDSSDAHHHESRLTFESSGRNSHRRRSNWLESWIDLSSCLLDIQLVTGSSDSYAYPSLLLEGHKWVSDTSILWVPNNERPTGCIPVHSEMHREFPSLTNRCESGPKARRELILTIFNLGAMS
jgi:hypothetical protein